MCMENRVDIITEEEMVMKATIILMGTVEEKVGNIKKIMPLFSTPSSHASVASISKPSSSIPSSETQNQL